MIIRLWEPVSVNWFHKIVLNLKSIVLLVHMLNWWFTLFVACRSVSGKSITDHLSYFGVNLMAKTWGSCKIVDDPRLLKYSTIDLEGNLVFSKTHLVSILPDIPRRGDNVTTSFLVSSWIVYTDIRRKDEEFVSFMKLYSYIIFMANFWQALDWIKHAMHIDHPPGYI